MPIFVGTTGNDSIVGGAADDTLQGNAGDDTLLGLAGNDSVDGGAANDVLDGGEGGDTLNGGAGNDRIFVDGSGDLVIEAAGGGSDTVFASASYALSRGAEVEVLAFNAALTAGGAIPATPTAPSVSTDAVNLTGNEFAQTIYGTAGANILVGGRNSNPSLGDTLEGGAGNDTFVVTNPNDSIVGGDGTDTIFVSASDLQAQGQAVATYSLAASGSSAEVLSAQNQQGTENLRLTGSATGGETIVGNFGANTLSGGGGGDTLIGLDGNDTYIFTSANDVISQETGGSDTVQFAAGSSAAFNFQTASGGVMKDASIERIELSAFTNNVTGTSIAQTIVGTAAAETLNGAGGVDTLVGGDGNDTYVVDVDGETITEGTVASAGASDVLIFNGTTGFNLANGVGIEVMAAGDAVTGARLGSSGDINGAGPGTPGVYLVGNTLSQSIYGAGGNDILDGDRGATGNADVLFGGAGDDIYRVYAQSDVVSEAQFDATGAIVAANAGGNDTIYTSANYSLATNAGTLANGVAAGDFVENLIAADATSTTGLSLAGGTQSNKIVGASGADTLNGGPGGVDTLQGLGGNDVYVLNATTDVVLEAAGGGTDTVTFATVAGFTSYTLTANSEVDVINLGGNVVSVTGNTLAQRINGATGAVNETIRGGGGADTLAGGDGNDVYFVSTDAATIVDTEGANYVGYVGTGGGFNIGNQATVTTLDGSGATGDIYLVGNNGVQTINGNDGNNILNGGGGLTLGGNGDTLVGGAGNDIYRVFSSNFDGVVNADRSVNASGRGDVITETASNGVDTVYTSANYVLDANVENLIAADQNFQTNLILVGNTLDNSVSGSAGNNVIAGGAGRDFLTGLGGADTFHFAHTGVANADTIQDFLGSQGDKISLDAGIFTGFGATIEGAEFQAGTVATGNQATILYDQATGRVFYDADGATAGGADAVLFAQLQPGTALSASDFLLTPAQTIPTPQA